MNLNPNIIVLKIIYFVNNLYEIYNFFFSYIDC